MPENIKFNMKERLVGLEKEKAPLSHVALIMDGNRRWAKLYHLPLIKGHQEGEKRIEPIVKRCRELGINVVTFYTLSIENLERPEEEVKELLKVLRNGIPLMFRRLEKEDVRFCALGDISRFPTDIHDAIRETETLTQNKAGIIVNLALAYGGRNEIRRAFQRTVRAGVKEEEITEELINSNLDTVGQPNPDLIIRTGGRHRLSGFLPWQGVYAEIYFSDILWPDFKVEEFNKAILWYQEQVRTFGN